MPRPWNPSYRFAFGGRWTPAVRVIIFGTAVVFLAQICIHLYSLKLYESIFGQLCLSFSQTIAGLKLWQLLTYLLLHDIGNPLHILGNMFFLWILGGEVESHLGTRRFVKLYLLGGIFVGLLTCLFYGLAGMVWGEHWLSDTVIGASGAVFAVLAAYGALFPERVILLFFLIPMKVKHAVLFIAGVEVLITLAGTTGIATTAHLGGLAFGYAFIRYGWTVRNLFIAYYEHRDRIRREHVLKIHRRVDELLVKVNKQGMDGLSWRERSFLKKASKRFRKPPQ